MKKILVAEDEQAIREFIVINLRRSGYDVSEAGDGEQALALYEAEGDFDVAVLDIMMPGKDGLEVCREIRSANSNIGIIMLTARTQEMDKVTGLMSGADDYMTKPFSPMELIARVDAIYRRVSAASAPAPKEDATVIELGEFVLNLRNRTLTKSGRYIELTQVEFQMMEYFFTNPGAALKRTDILEKVWGTDYYGDDKIVDVNIRRLRMKVEDDPSDPRNLITIWGVGYKWVV